MLLPIEVLVGFDDVQIEGNGKIQIGLEAGEYPAHHLGGIDLEDVVHRHHLPGGGTHFARPPLNADKVVLEIDGGSVAKNFDDTLGGGIGAPQGGVIFPTRLKIDSFLRPTHGPVDAPGKFDVGGGGNLFRKLLLGVFAPIDNFSSFPTGTANAVVPIASKGVDAQGEPIRGQGFGPVFIEDRHQFIDTIQRQKNVLAVLPGAVLVGLIEKFRVDIHLFELLFKGPLVVGGVGTLRAVGIGHVHDGAKKDAFSTPLDWANWREFCGRYRSCPN